MADKLRSAYFNPSHSGSFGGPRRLSIATGVSQTKAKTFLEHEETYTRNKAVRHKFLRRKINVPSVDYLWQADLISVSKFSRKNKGTNFLLTIICALSRFAFVRALRNKSARVVVEAFADILQASGRKCKFLQTDQGTEFHNAQFKQFMSDNDIKLFYNHSELKAAMIERFNRTLMLRLNKYFIFTNDTRYIENLPGFVDSYNSSIHRITKFRPKDVDKFNQFEVWTNSNKELLTRPKTRSKFQLGDYVRIKIQKAIFVKGYTSTFTSDLYKIREIVNSEPITYKLCDNLEENILGVFYPEELSKVII